MVEPSDVRRIWWLSETVHNVSYFAPEGRAATDALGRSDSSVWDASNNRVSVSDRNGGATTYAYGDRGNMTLLTDPARATKEVGVANTLPLNSPTEQIDRLLVPDDAPA